METTQTLVLDYPFANVYEELKKMAQVDGVSGGLSPITFRWLTSKNRYVNIGLEEKVENKSCEVKANNNSFAVAPKELTEIFEAVKTHMSKAKDMPDFSSKEHRTVSIKESSRAKLEGVPGALIKAQEQAEAKAGLNR